MGIKVIAKNKRANYDFSVKETLEAGVMLQGTEVKSLRDGKVRLAEAYISIDKNEEVWIHNMHIAHYAFGNIANHNENRKRKLLLNKKEIEKMKHRVKAEALTMIPIKIYFKKNYVKIEIALAKGKKLYDKRNSEAEKDASRRIREGNY